MVTEAETNCKVLVVGTDIVKRRQNIYTNTIHKHKQHPERERYYSIIILYYYYYYYCIYNNNKLSHTLMVKQESELLRATRR